MSLAGLSTFKYVGSPETFCVVSETQVIVDDYGSIICRSGPNIVYVKSKLIRCNQV